MDSSVNASGAILAEHPGMQSLEQAERWYRARATAAYMTAMRAKLVWLIGLDSLIVAVLAAIGYPAPRVIALALTFCASLGMFVYWLSRNCECVPEQMSSRDETLGMVPRFVLMFVMLGITGGIRSPLLPVALIPFSDLVIKNGWSQTAKNILVILASGLVALAVLPAR
jgi:hypothetical protein